MAVDDDAGEDRDDKIATNLRKGVLEYCVLALLARRDHYGLELATDLIGRSLSASEGSLYPLLARMREAGTVTTYWDSPGGSRPRRYYALTDTGRTQLAAFTRIWRHTGDQVSKLLEET